MRGKCPQIHTCSVHFAGLTRHDGHSWPYGQHAACPWESASASWPALLELSAPLIHSLSIWVPCRAWEAGSPALVIPPVPPPFWQTSRGVQSPTYPTVTLRQRDSGTEFSAPGIFLSSLHPHPGVVSSWLSGVALFSPSPVSQTRRAVLLSFSSQSARVLL